MALARATVIVFDKVNYQEEITKTSQCIRIRLYVGSEDMFLRQRTKVDLTLYSHHVAVTMPKVNIKCYNILYKEWFGSAEEPNRSPSSKFNQNWQH